jgi:hypothetical protein
LNARDEENYLLKRCAAVARDLPPVSDALPSAHDAREANVFRVASMVVNAHFPVEAARLLNASEHYFAQYPDALLSPVEVVRRSWVLNLPRFHDMLSLALRQN